MTETQEIYTFIMKLDDSKPVELTPPMVISLKALLLELRGDIVELMKQRDRLSARLSQWEEE